MSRLIPQADMSADQIIDGSYDIMAIFAVAEVAARHLEEQPSARLASSLARLMKLADELYSPLHDALERHEGLKGGVA